MNCTTLYCVTVFLLHVIIAAYIYSELHLQHYWRKSSSIMMGSALCCSDLHSPWQLHCCIYTLFPTNAPPLPKLNNTWLMEPIQKEEGLE